MGEHSDALLDRLLPRCSFPDRSPVACAFSGGPDSTALLALARHSRLEIVAHHVDHGLRPESGAEAARARGLAERLGATFVLHRVDLGHGPNLEARARDARRAVIPAGAMTGHTADDQAETVLLRLLRGSGRRGLGGIRPGPEHPILALRRAETASVCAALGLDPVIDPSNATPAMWRNRVRHELLPLATDIGGRDPVPILARTAELLRDDEALLAGLAEAIDPTDAKALVAAPLPLARRAIRGWLTDRGYPPDAAAVERVLAVATGAVDACELAGGRRVVRSRQRLTVIAADAARRA